MIDDPSMNKKGGTMDFLNRTRVLPSGIAALALSATLLAFAPTSARSHWDYYAEMSGQEMVPPTSSSGTGLFHGTFPGHTQCPDERDLLMLGLSVEDLEGSPTAAVLWIGEDGEVGEFFARFPLDATGVAFTQNECWNLDGNMYVVIETDLHPLGEIRGRIVMEVSMPVAERTWGAIKHVY
jgi:hypothetical protein